MQEDVRELLGDTAAIAAIVAERIYPGQVPDDETPRPWLYYAVPDSTPLNQLDGVAAVRHGVEFHAMADSYAQAQALTQAVIDLLDGFRGGRRVDLSLWEGTAEEVNDEGYHHVARFAVDAKSPTGLVVGNGTFPSCSGSFLIAPKGF